MALFKNDVNDTDLVTALASGSIADADSILFYRWDTDFETNGDAHAAKNLQDVTFTKGFSGDFDKTRLVFTANQTASKVKIAHSGRVLRLGAGGGTLKEIICHPQSNLWLDLDNAIVPTFRGYMGELYGGSSLNLTNGYFSGSMRARLLASANAVTALEVRKQAFVELQRDLATGNIYGGQLKINHVNVTPGTLNVFGGNVAWFAAGASGGTLNAKAAILDFSQLEADIAFAGGTIDHDCIIRRPKSGVTFDLSACTFSGGEPDYE